MKTKKKIFLPKWQRWFIVPFFIGTWLFTTYMEFFNPGNTEKLGPVGFIFMTILFLGLSVMMWLMQAGNSPLISLKKQKRNNPGDFITVEIMDSYEYDLIGKY